MGGTNAKSVKYNSRYVLALKVFQIELLHSVQIID